MELVRVVSPLATREALMSSASRHKVLWHCSDYDTVLAAASLVDRIAAPFGVWLEVHDGYRAQLCARDVATLSHLIPLHHVVVAAGSNASAHAEVVRALLTNDEVNFTNDVVNLVGAYNRPAPPHPLSVWSYDDGRLVNGDDVLVEGRSEVIEQRVLTFFA